MAAGVKRVAESARPFESFFKLTPALAVRMIQRWQIQNRLTNKTRSGAGVHWHRASA